MRPSLVTVLVLLVAVGVAGCGSPETPADEEDALNESPSPTDNEEGANPNLPPNDTSPEAANGTTPMTNETTEANGANESDVTEEVIAPRRRGATSTLAPVPR